MHLASKRGAPRCRRKCARLQRPAERMPQCRPEIRRPISGAAGERQPRRFRPAWQVESVGWPSPRPSRSSARRSKDRSETLPHLHGKTPPAGGRSPARCRTVWRPEIRRWRAVRARCGALPSSSWRRSRAPAGYVQAKAASAPGGSERAMHRNRGIPRNSSDKARLHPERRELERRGLCRRTRAPRV